jgi:hypothetical protein
MGQYFYYANLDRKEYFNIGLGAQNDKAGGIGHGFGARALGLLLRHDGAWARQRIAVIGDETVEYESEIRAHFRPIDSSVLLLLFASDREDLMTAAAGDELLFTRLGELAVVHGAREIAGALAHAFGADWKKRYGELRKEMPWLVVPPP